MLKSLGSITLVLVLSKIERLPSGGTRAFQLLIIMHYIFLPEIVPNLFFDLQKILSSIESATTWQILIPQKTSGILPKTSLITLLLHLSLLYVLLMAHQLSPLSLKLNSSLKLLLLTQIWTTQGMFLPLTPPLTISCLLLKFLRMKFSMPFLGLTLGRLMDLMEFPLSFLKTVPLC